MQQTDPITDRNVIASWMDLIDTGEAMLRAGLRLDHGEAEMESVFRAIQERERAERDRDLEKLLATLSRRESQS